MKPTDYKVIQFMTEGAKRRLEKGYYMPSLEWNPTREIAVYTLDDLPMLESNKLVFVKKPDLTTEGHSTFIQNPLNPYEYMLMGEIGDNVKLKREEAIVNILQKLGVRDYIVKTRWTIDVGTGNSSDSRISGEAGYGPAKGEVSKENNEAFSAHFKAHYSKCRHKVYAPFNPTMEQWEEARNLAKRYGIYNGDIYNIIEARKPGDNPKLLFDHSELSLAGDVEVNLNIASKLQALIGIKGIKAGCSLFGALDFKAYACGRYCTEFCYNFDPDRNDEYIKDALKRITDEEKRDSMETQSVSENQ